MLPRCKIDRHEAIRMTKDRSMSVVWKGIKCDWEASSQPGARVLEVAERLISATRTAGFPPECASTGYWPTICLFWDGGQTEVEVFEESFELYFLPKSQVEGSFSVREFNADMENVLETLVAEIRKQRSAKQE